MSERSQTMSLEQLIARVIEAGAMIAFDPVGDSARSMRITVHRAGHTPVTCGTQAKPGELDWIGQFARLLATHGVLPEPPLTSNTDSRGHYEQQP